VLFVAPSNYRLVFALAAVPALLSLSVLWLGVSETTQPSSLPPSSALSLRQIGQGVKELPSAFRWYLASVLLFTLSNSSDAFLLLRAKSCGVAEETIPLLWTWLHIVKSGTTTHGGLLSDRIGRLNAIRLGWLVYAGVYASFAFLQSAWQVWLAFTVYGLYFGVLWDVWGVKVAFLWGAALALAAMLLLSGVAKATTR
jgi:hypothetical protein